MKTVVISDDLALAVDIISSGGLVAVPTETVYGLAANGLDEKAVAEIYRVKGRPETKPISLLISDMAAVEKLCMNIPEAAYVLAEKFWPGPLTMVLEKKETVPDIVTAGGKTVGVRCPAHEATLEIIRRCDLPLATPSANLSGMPSPKDVKGVMGYFDGKIPCVVDGGACSVGIESTVLLMTVTPPKVLRAGGLSAERIKAETGIEVDI